MTELLRRIGCFLLGHRDLLRIHSTGGAAPFNVCLRCGRWGRTP